MGCCRRFGLGRLSVALIGFEYEKLVEGKIPRGRAVLIDLKPHLEFFELVSLESHLPFCPHNLLRRGQIGKLPQEDLLLSVKTIRF